MNQPGRFLIRFPCKIAVVSVLLAPIASASTPARAQSDPYRITEAEKAACTGDAARLCADTYPDEGKLLVCMETNKSSLTPSCLVVFDAGVKRRRLAKQ